MKSVYVLIETATDKFWQKESYNGRRGVYAFLSKAKADATLKQFRPKPDPDEITVQEYTPFNNIEVAEWGVKYTISQFLKMSLENPGGKINIDEVKRRAMEDVKNRYEVTLDKPKKEQVQ